MLITVTPAVDQTITLSVELFQISSILSVQGVVLGISDPLPASLRSIRKSSSSYPTVLQLLYIHVLIQSLHSFLAEQSTTNRLHQRHKTRRKEHFILASHS